VRNLLLTIEWHGGQFHGWQFQPEQRTIQGELQAAIETLLRHPIKLTGAGRTDAGVHGLAMTANFETGSDLSEEKIQRSINGITGDDLMVTAVREVPPGFNARFSATGRHYVYLLLENRSALWEDRAYWTKRFPDPDLMNQACAALPGQHDFAAFSCSSADENGTDSLLYYARWEPWGRGLAFRIGAVRFLYKMVRCLVAGSLAVGTGKLPPDSFSHNLASPEGRGELVAPAHGLYFVRCDYDSSPAMSPWGPDCLPEWPVL
jgi:tRNA pseudouridine38-40 synthase